MLYSEAELKRREQEDNAELLRERALANAVLPEIRRAYPPAAEIKAREFSWPEKRKPRLSDLDSAKLDLARDIAQYDDFRDRGGECLNHYSISIGAHGGVAALEQALRLKHAHISWDLGKIAWLEEQLSTQKALF